MQMKNLSISLPVPLVNFIEKYKTSHQYQSPSQVIEAALELLRNRELEEAYRQASEEVDSDWDITIGDGLTDETWVYWMKMYQI
ncbi:CopG family transcriptional regulator [[Phormidium ambiguum] IAM M-71]|uniref:CopG family transcriptional regulator n=1 Tax=[Phormidium ambiguum] IAM M-71 TaxID=454136 RepID=A0A1U7IFS6_9CYAN|nr:type II toxin-antitoxin system ParD family antitoxin [Phormidium ambiguum]OKH35841.1 CopG family transcriptional regulator [Phormidium ambiguum IAM M-71]